MLTDFCITESAMRNRPRKRKGLLKMAHTGKAALNILGYTIHTALGMVRILLQWGLLTMSWWLTSVLITHRHPIMLRRTKYTLFETNSGISFWSLSMKFRLFLIISFKKWTNGWTKSSNFRTKVVRISAIFQYCCSEIWRNASQLLQNRFSGTLPVKLFRFGLTYSDPSTSTSTWDKATNESFLTFFVVYD